MKNQKQTQNKSTKTTIRNKYISVQKKDYKFNFVKKRFIKLKTMIVLSILFILLILINKY